GRSAVIEKNRNRKRLSCLALKNRNLLRNAVIPHFEIGFFERAHGRPAAVFHCRENMDEPHIGAERRILREGERAKQEAEQKTTHSRRAAHSNPTLLPPRLRHP